MIYWFKKTVCFLLVLVPLFSLGQELPFYLQKETFKRLPFGAVKPAGWIKKQMQNDVKGFVGNLDKIVPDLINDPIYSARLHKHSRAKDLGNLKEGDIGGDDQYKWWNSETQSNWRDGYIRNIMLLNNAADKEKVKQYIYKITGTQDKNGYLGIYDSVLRYHFTAENGELWAKTTLLRGLLAYYEITGEKKTWLAVVRAVDDVFKNYPVYLSNPFFAGTEFSGGVAHGLTFTDVCDEMYRITGDKKYREYALFLYQNFSSNFSFEKDVQLQSILNPAYKLSGHGVHTYEHVRPLIVAAYSTSDPVLRQALPVYLQRIEACVTPSGGPIGDEWIGGRLADATETGYEYCSIQELLDSYMLMLQKSGDAIYGDKAEKIFYNAAQGARNPCHSGIAYLKTDNSYEMTGGKNGSVKEKNQTRYKYSAAHKDAAVCCVPNAGRITPYFVQNMWMKEDDNTLIAALLGPSVLNTKIGNVPVSVNEITEYPYRNRITFKLSAASSVAPVLKIRKPGWAAKITCNVPYKMMNDYIVINKKISGATDIVIEFDAEVIVHTDAANEKYFTYGALVYAHSLEANEMTGKKYAPGFQDYLYTGKNKARYSYVADNKAVFNNDIIFLQLKNENTNQTEPIRLIPVSKTILRQVTF
ncbi:MAG: glycoside hydrolase family 127 protein [Niabella sp.]